MKVLVFVLATMVLLFTGCSKEKISGSGSIITQQRSESNFTGISMSGANNVHVTKGAAFNVEIRGYSNLLSYYETRVVNSILRLGYKNDVNVRNDNIEVYVTLPVLNSLSIAGSGNIDVAGSFDSTNSFEINIAGSGNISLQQGITKNFSSTISGSGNILAFGITAQNATINISGSGNTEITATSLLDVTISGSGDVYYKGNPVITSHVSGSGSIIPR
jgi:hypothetical protein